MSKSENPQGLDRSYELIIDHLLHFGTGHISGVCGHVQGSRVTAPLIGFVSENLSVNYDLKKGDLCLLNKLYANSPEFRLSWFEGMVPDQDPDRPVFILRSAKTGKLGEWNNVGLRVFNRYELDQFPAWRWTNEQHEFADLWKKVCSNQSDYTLRANIPEFTDGADVVLGLYNKYAFTRTSFKQCLKNWREATEDDLVSVYASIRALYKNSNQDEDSPV